jgi:hypothetical protein
LRDLISSSGHACGLRLQGELMAKGTRIVYHDMFSLSALGCCVDYVEVKRRASRMGFTASR